jgi:nicotinate-nucleotide adenylyltransferase
VRNVIPPHAAGMRIGLFGGSFNPPHAGHRLVAETALRRLQLHQVWWLVTPGNPLKDVSALPPLNERMAACSTLMGHNPRHIITGLEEGIGTRYTAQTLAFLHHRCPNVYFVWVMGADNLTHFHRWNHWQDIADTMPLAVVDRPGETLRAMASPAARRLARVRFDESDAALLPTSPAPAFVMLHGRRSPLSSTLLRKE